MGRTGPETQDGGRGDGRCENVAACKHVNLPWSAFTEY
jgi:hypothetical protein